MSQVNWFDRKFDFSGNTNIFPSILARLDGTPHQLRKKLSSIPKELLIVKPEGKWSAQEHTGHLIDLEPLWQLRLTDILAGEKYLRETDLQNMKTHQANHNAKFVDSLLDEFAGIRQKTLLKLKTLTEADIYKAALHPRLLTPMRVMDLFLFVAEHDDHHLAKINEIIKEQE